MYAKDINLKMRGVVLSALLLIFCALTIAAKNGGLDAFEGGVYAALARHINPVLTSIMTAITSCGSTGAVIAVILVLLLVPFTRMKFGVPVAINAIFSSLLNNVLKILIARDRPDILRLAVETGYGFPSGHAMNNTALYAIVILIVFRQTKNKKIRAFAVIYGITASLLIGTSRIFLGVHNAGDVLAGWVMGVAVALLVDTAYSAFLSKRRHTR